MGSLFGTALGANWLIPEIGMRATMAVAAGAYGMASMLLVLPARRVHSPRAGAPPLGWRVPPALGVAAGVSGALVVGLQILLLRRLPFFLEGFQPTLSGVLAAVLLGLTAGSALGTPLLARLARERAAPIALAAAALCLCLGLQEHASLPLSRWRVASEWTLHARIWLAALAAAGPACFFLGAVLPLCVSRSDAPEARSALAGRLFFWQGVGSLAGSLLVGQLLPALAPTRFFVVTVPVLVVLTALLLARELRPAAATALGVVALAAALTGLSGAGTLLRPDPLSRRRAGREARRCATWRTARTARSRRRWSTTAGVTAWPCTPTSSARRRRDPSPTTCRCSATCPSCSARTWTGWP